MENDDEFKSVFNMNIAEYLVQDESNLELYFPGNTDAWLKSYKESLKRIDHDEPWVTLISMYAIFGDLSQKKDPQQLAAFNELIMNCGIQNPPKVIEIGQIKVEKQFKEVRSITDYLKNIATNKNCILHHYPDRIDTINKKSGRDRVSFEGNTNVGLFIEAFTEDRPVYFFIEAKFLSDISYQVLYSPVRDQISRNIDTGIEFITKVKKLDTFGSLYFMMLTPRQFRTELYGGNGNPPLSEFHPERSRLYCYKMNEFNYYKNLKASLPHRHEIKDDDWMQITENIGWITFEDVYNQAVIHDTVDPAEKAEIKTFFTDRNLV
jgi:hypothetical protein